MRGVADVVAAPDGPYTVASDRAPREEDAHGDADEAEDPDGVDGALRGEEPIDGAQNGSSWSTIGTGTRSSNHSHRHGMSNWP